MVLEGLVLYDVAASNVPISPGVSVDGANVIEFDVKLPVLLPRVKVPEGLVLNDVAVSDKSVTPEVFADGVSVVGYDDKLPVPVPRNVELEGSIPFVPEDVADSDGTADHGTVVDWLAGIGNGGDREVDTPAKSVEALLTVIARR